MNGSTMLTSSLFTASSDTLPPPQQDAKRSKCGQATLTNCSGGVHTHFPTKQPKKNQVGAVYSIQRGQIIVVRPNSQQSSKKSPAVETSPNVRVILLLVFLPRLMRFVIAQNATLHYFYAMLKRLHINHFVISLSNG